MDKKKKQKPESHENLEGFDIKINELGQITSTLPLDRLNEFLDENVEDKKLKDRKDLYSEEE